MPSKKHSTQKISEKDILFIPDDDTHSPLLQDNGDLIVPDESQPTIKQEKAALTESLSAIAPLSPVGKKNNEERYKIDTLKKKFSFSWDKLGRRLLIFAMIFGGFLLVGTTAVVAWGVDQYNKAPSVDALAARPAESTVVYARDGTTVLFEFFKEDSKREVIPLCKKLPDGGEDISVKCIPENMQLAIIAIEHKDFYLNENGIPWKNLAGAAYKCLEGTQCRGASGLSQQLIKNITKDDSSSISRKVRELFTAVKLNNEKDHAEILEMYLNQVPFGRNNSGVQQAAQSYFGKDANQLNVHEACLLASMPQSPSTYSENIAKPDSAVYQALIDRKDDCLNTLKSQSLYGNGGTPFINEGTFAFHYEKPIVQVDNKANKGLIDSTNTSGAIAIIPNIVNYPFPHFREYVIDELRKFDPIIKETDLYTRGYRITTTLDPVLQRDLEATINKSAAKYSIPVGANNAAGVVLDGPTGQIISMVGSLDYNNNAIDGQVNIVTTPQQPGSSIKPYVYAAALEQNFNPGTVLLDVKTSFINGTYTPKNFDGTFSGPRTIRSALQNSLNIPAVKAAYLAAGTGPDATKGINTVFDFAEKVGVVFPCAPLADGGATCKDPEKSKRAYRDRCGLSAALGGCELTVLSNTVGYNTFAQDGEYIPATPFINIIDSQGNDIYKRIQESDRPIYPRKKEAVDPLIARQMSDILSDYNTRKFDTKAQQKVLQWLQKLGPPTM
jgi:membrane peptidoglycan carboxypeptidase